MEHFITARNGFAIRSRTAPPTQRVKLKALTFTLMLALFVWLLLAAMGPAPAHAQGYDAQRAVERKEMVRTLYKTERCMNQGSTAMLRQGVTSRAAVTRFTIGVCGLPLLAELRRKGWEDETAANLVVTLADYSYDEAARWGQ